MSGRPTLLVLFISALLFFAPGKTVSAQVELKTVKIEMAGCVKYDYEHSNYIFKDAAALKAARPGYKTRDCNRIVKNIDFNKYVLLGAQFQNAECRDFALEHKLIKDDAAKRYRFQVTYPPLTSPCAGISHYEIWVLAPKLPAGYETAFEIGARRSPEEEQFGKNVQVSPAAGYASRSINCLNVDNRVYNEESLKKLLSFAQCSNIISGDKIDLKKQTLIGWQAGGDCRMTVDTNFYRNDGKKLFTLVIKNIWGGCRAGGWRQGMFTVDKIPSDYKVKFVEYLVEDRAGKDSREASDSGAVWTADGQNIPPIATETIDIVVPDSKPENSPPAGGGVAAASADGVVGAATGPNIKSAAKPISLETREIDIFGCISLRFSSYDAVIDDDEAFQKAVRKDGQEDYCKKNLEKIDFSKNTLLGVNLDTGYCRIPAGLKSKAVRDDEKKQVTLQISYIKPNGLCRALSSYDLWVLAPKIPDGYEVKFEEKAMDR